MNKLFIVGNLTRDPELRSTPNGKAVCNFTVAVNRRYTPQGEENKADFFKVTAWGALGESCARYLMKGKKVAVIGEVSVQTYKDRNGETRASLEVNASDVEFLSPKSEGSDSVPSYAPSYAPEATGADTFSDVSDADIPF